MPLHDRNIRGVKRRRLDDKESEKDKEAKLHRKLHHTLRELHRVIKKARTFEVQKTLKKLKDARRKDPESDVTKDLEAQIEILKHLSYDQLAHSALVAKLKKDKTLSANPSIRAFSAELALNLVSSGVPGTPTARVQSRILSSKILASEVVSIVGTLRTLLYPSEGSEDAGEATDKTRPSLHIAKKRRTETGHEKDGFLPKGDEGYETTNDDEAIAEVDDGWESGTVDLPSETDDPVAGSADDRDSGSGDSDDATSGRGSSDGTDFPSADAKNKQSPSHRSRGLSEFFPSLSVGFTRGDSASEFSEGEPKLVDGIKKNRRGQRARRAIWEKKFGRNANHIKKSPQMTVRGTKRRSAPANVDRRSGKRDSSLRPRRPLIQSRAPVYGHEPVRKPTHGASESEMKLASTKGQAERIRHYDDRRGKQGERPLHPSWEARRKQKAASIVPSQGTKIVFSES